MDIKRDDKAGLIKLGAAKASALGKFYTPEGLARLVARLAYCPNARRIYDPTVGAGSLLLYAREYFGDDATYVGEEIDAGTVEFCKENFKAFGAAHYEIYNTDVLLRPTTLEPVDAVVANPPFSVRWEPEKAKDDPTFPVLAPRNRADCAFFFRALDRLRPGGKAAIIGNCGSLFRDGAEKEARKTWLGELEAVILTPTDLFEGTGIPVVVFLFQRAEGKNSCVSGAMNDLPLFSEKQRKPFSDVLFVDASALFKKVGPVNIMRESDVQRVIDAVEARENVEGLCRLVSFDEIRDNDYNFNLPRYIDTCRLKKTGMFYKIEKEKEKEIFDPYSEVFGGASDEELSEFEVYWSLFPNLFAELFERRGARFFRKVDNIKAKTLAFPEVATFIAQYEGAFKEYGEKVAEALSTIDDAFQYGEQMKREAMNIASGIPFVDRYDALQIAADAWNVIKGDLITIQNDGLETARTSDELIPLALIQSEYFCDQLDALEQLKERLKDLQAERDDYTNSMVEEEKNLQRNIRTASRKLIDAAKEKRATATPDETRALLVKKWVPPLVDELQGLLRKALEAFASRLEKIAKKYDEPLVEIDAKIKETENALAGMLRQLVGSEEDMALVRALADII